MAGSSLGTTSTKTKPASSTASLVTGSSSAAAPRNTAAQNAAVASLLSGAGTRSTGGINAALPQPPRLTKAQIGNRFTQSLASGASTGAAVPNPAGLTRDEADTLRSRFYTQFYSGQPVQRIADKPVPVSYDYMFGARNDDKPYVSPYDVARYGSMNSAPGLLPSKEFGGYPGARPEAKLASTLLAGGAGALDAVVSPTVGFGAGLLDYLSGGTPDDFMNSYAGGYRDANAVFQPYASLDPLMYRKGGNASTVASVAYGLPGVGPTRAAAAAAGVPRVAAGIDAAMIPPVTPRQAAFRELMDSLNAGERAAAATPTPAVNVGPRVTPGGGQPAEMASLDAILAKLDSAPRPAAVGSRLPDAANVLDEGFVSRAAAANDERLLANMMRENDTRGLTNAINENDALVLRNAKRENDMRNALNARADGSDQFFFDVNPAMRYMDPDEAANIIRRPGGQTVYPPGFMSADEAADVLRPGPRVAADADRMDPFTKNMLIAAAAGAGVGIPGLAGLSLLANGQLGPAPTVTTPQPAAVPRGAASGAPRSARALRQAQINQSAANLDPAIASQDQFNKWLVDNALANAPVERIAVDAEGAPVGVVGETAEDLGAYPTVNSPGQVELVGAEDTRPVDRLPVTTSEDINRFNELFEDDSGDVPRAADGAAPGVTPTGTAAPAAGTKFTPGPGQFVGTNGYIYEQSSDGSFENVGRVPGYTPAQLSEAANKGAFRDPNNIVTGGAKPRKQVRKKKEGEETFFDKAGNILKERFDDSLFARLFLNQDDDDAAAGEAAAGPEAVEYYSTPPASVPESLVASASSSKKRKPKDETDTGTGTGGTGTGGTGTGGTGTSPYTPEMQAMLDALYGNYMRQYNGPGVGYVPGVDPERNYFTPAFADGGLVDGRLVLGDGGPKEDKIPAMIDGVEQAKLSNGEFVMTAAAVKNAGDGDIELGAKRLMDLNNMLSYGKPADQLKVQHVK
jgi:hypothetical protein